ncbi:hypothetical protein FMM05_03240 [Flavobacterium zepuense]|uniref:Lipoprotein n=1 Tax=Flavobacterium zepuense TaxID=2593302 RepID=A0A552V7G9_9FLAO|nr:hypothetical protein [Flavobacterium zepuense]TRW26408.1 hypothetical protein FMM05_03240 [Flavobacterium zepuense]
MKIKFFVVLFLLIIGVSCKNETVPKESNYPENIVGTAQGESYTVTSADVIQPEWEKYLSDKSSSIETFEIIKGRTTGDAVKDFYMLVGKCKDGQTIAALLDLKGNNFYFNQANPVAVRCHGTCTGGCLPIATAIKGAVFLSCSPCADCIKTDHFL